MKLTDTQKQILATAANRADGLALPPDRLPPAPRQAVGKALVKAGLVAAAAEVTAEAGTAWTIDGESALLRITDAGLAAIGAGEPRVAEQPQEGPMARAVKAEAPADADAAQTAQEAPQEPASAVPGAEGRIALRDAATVLLAAWDASSDGAGIDEAITTLRKALAGKAPRQPRQSGAPRRPREGTKQQQVLALLRQPEGVTVAQIAEATGWQPHTVRGFFAGLKARQGITVEVLERVRQVGPDKQGAKGSYSIYRIADAG